MDGDIDRIVRMLDGFADAGEGRMKIEVSEDVPAGEARRRYHHGRCDVDSPWARGCAFDVLPRFTTVVFDLDGTLLDTLEDLTDSANVVLGRFGFPTRTMEEIRRAVGSGLWVLIQRIVPEGTPQEEARRAFEAFQAYYVEHCNRKTRPYQGTVELLRRLKAKGCKTAVVSNKADEAVGLLLEEHFKGLVDVSAGLREGIRRKPSPDSVFAVMEKLGAVRESTIYVGDSDVDKATADNAGLDCVCVTWGFRDRELLRSLHPRRIVDSTEELYQFLTEAV